MNEEILIDLRIPGAEESEKRVTELTQSIIDLTKANKDLQAENKALEKTGKDNSQQYVDNAKQIEINKQKIQENSASRKGLIQTIVAEDNSIKGLKVQNAELIKQRDQINTKTMEGREAIALINSQLDQNNKIIKENSSALEQQKQNVGNYKEDIIAAAQESELFGFSVNGIKESFLKLANPVTAAVTLVGGLVSAYLASAAGARDLETAQTSLTSNFKFLSNELARLVGADGKGGGLLTNLANAFNLAVFGIDGFSRGIIAGFASNELKELELTELTAQRVAKVALDESERLRRARDDENKSFEDRLKAARQVEGFINVREQVLVKTQEEKLTNLKLLLAQDKDNLELQKEIKQVEFEIADIREDSQGKRTEAINGIRALYNAERDEAKALADDLASFNEERLMNQKEYFDESYTLNRDYYQLLAELRAENIEAEQDEEENIAEVSFGRKTFWEQQEFDLKMKLIKQGMKAEEAAAKAHEIIEQNKLKITSDALGQASTLFKKNTLAYKATASAQVIIDTYAGATAAFRSLASIPVVGSVLGAIAAAAAIASGLANLAKINGIQFARGGLTGGVLSGPSHAQGGIPFSVGGRVGFEAEGGEAIINKRSTSMFRDQLSAINVAGGGVPFAAGGITGNETRIAAFNAQQQITSNELATLINQVQTVLVLESFEAKQAEVNNTQRLAKVI